MLILSFTIRILETDFLIYGWLRIFLFIPGFWKRAGGVRVNAREKIDKKV